MKNYSSKWRDLNSFHCRRSSLNLSFWRFFLLQSSNKCFQKYSLKATGRRDPSIRPAWFSAPFLLRTQNPSPALGGGASDRSSQSIMHKLKGTWFMHSPTGINQHRPAPPSSCFCHLLEAGGTLIFWPTSRVTAMLTGADGVRGAKWCLKLDYERSEGKRARARENNARMQYWTGWLVEGE